MQMPLLAVRDAAPPQVAVTLRPYQVECLEAIRQAWQRGERRLLASLATGTGKTVIAAHLPTMLGVERMLMLAHREELLDQAKHKLMQANPLVDVAIEQADRSADHETPIVVASVPTLGRSGSRRIAKWAPDYFEVIVIDESHHATSDTYVNIMRYFHVGEPDGPLLLGITATGFRGDKTPLSNVFDRVVFDYPIQQGIREGYLCRLRAVRVRSKTDLTNVGTRLGDFAENELATEANTDYRNSLICSAIEEHAADRRCILVFCINISHTEELTKQLQERGHAAECVTSYTKSADRAAIFRRFREGLTRVLVNCGVATEGYDNPAIDTIVMARPTKSALLFTQMIGRGTRPSPETSKVDTLIIDVVDICGRHRIQTATTAFGLRDIDLLGGDVLEAVETCEKAADFGITIEDGMSIDEIAADADVMTGLAKRTIKVETVAQAINVFEATAVAEEVAHESEFPWVRLGQDHYVIQIDRATTYPWPGTPGRRVDLKRDTLGVWKCQFTGTYIGGANCGTDDAPPFADADRLVKRHAGAFKSKDGHDVEKWRALSTHARWRKDPPSEAQIRQLSRLGIKALPPDLTKGAASHMLNTITALRATQPKDAPRP